MAFRQTYSSADLDLLHRKAVEEARASFYAYRQYLDPKFKRSWFQRSISHALEQFWDDLCAGKRPKLALFTPPQHGKSRAVTEFLSWAAGKNPDIQAIYTSFSDRLGVRANLALQRLYDGPKFSKVFPGTKINTSNVVTISGQYLRNREILEYTGREGGFRNTTVNGPVTGETLGLGVIDDPVKGREAANSPAIREKTWNWFTDDFFTRFSEDAGFLLIMTPWHVDDVGQRMVDHFPDMRLLKFPAVAEHDEEHRAKGEALFPDHKSLGFLAERRAVMTAASWEAIYQANPIVTGGGTFPIERFGLVDLPPPANEIERAVRYWDKAGTADGGAFTAGVMMVRLADGRFCVADVERGQWDAFTREKIIKDTVQADAAKYGKKLATWVEQEPGSGGKESAQRTIANLAGHVVKADRVTGDKETRAEPYAAQVQGGNVLLVRGKWVRAFLDEHEAFPNGKYKDQVDAAAGGFVRVTDRQPATKATRVIGLY